MPPLGWALDVEVCSAHLPLFPNILLPGAHTAAPHSERPEVRQRLTAFMSFWHKLQTLWIADVNNDLANEEGARDVPGIVYYRN